MSKESRSSYDSDLTDAEWELVRPLLPPHPPRGNDPRIPKREILNAIFYVNKHGCTWRGLPHDLPKWQTVYAYFRLWTKTGVWERMNAVLRNAVREAEGKASEPTAAIIDSQSVKTTEKGGYMGMMRARRSMVANAISWSIRWGYCWP